MKLDEINRILIENNVLHTMHMDMEPISFKYNLLLSLSDDENSRDKVSLYFYDVSSVKMRTEERRLGQECRSRWKLYL